MIRILKKVALSAVSVLGVSCLFWAIFLINPNLSYAHQTQFDNITVFHNQDLEEDIELRLKNAIEIIKNSEIYDENLHIDLCLSDDKIYPQLHPFKGGCAYAFFDKTVIYASTPNFKNNVAEFKWEINNYQLRKYNLTALLAHEFTHNLQFNFDTKYMLSSTIGKINWKLEGHADYVARQFKNDGLLKDKIDKYLIEENKEHFGVPIFTLEDGTIQNLGYFKYAIVVQYLIEEKKMNFAQICKLETSFDELYAEMILWRES